MLDNLLEVVKKEGLTEQLCTSLLGIEIEENRIDKLGRLSRRPHPKVFGSRTFHPYLQSDFGESQTELITAPNSRVGDALDQLDTLQTVLNRSLDGDDQIWPLSMPPAISKDDRQFIKAHFGRPAYQHYRDYLTQKYGVDRKIMTGVHVNFSLPESVITSLFGHYQHQFKDVLAFRNALYFRIAQNMVLRRFLLTYLFGATPVAEAGFYDDHPLAPITHPVRSIRSSQYGYANYEEDDVGADIYQSLPHFINTLEARVASGTLYSQAEFYGPVRFRGQPALPDYLTQGIKYLEFRVFDNAPFTANGVSHKGLQFLKLYFLYLLVTPVDQTNIELKLREADQFNNQVALEEPNKPTFMEEQALVIFQDLHDFAVDLRVPAEQLTVLEEVGEAITHPDLTPAARLVKQLENGSLMSFGVKRAAELKAQRMGTTSLLPAHTQLSIPAQKLVFRAIQLGILYEVVQTEDNKIRLKLSFDGTTQIIDDQKLVGQSPTAYLHQLFETLPT